MGATQHYSVYNPEILNEGLYKTVIYFEVIFDISEK
jgi:hypothetical protein